LDGDIHKNEARLVKPAVSVSDYCSAMFAVMRTTRLWCSSKAEVLLMIKAPLKNWTNRAIVPDHRMQAVLVSCN